MHKQQRDYWEKKIVTWEKATYSTDESGNLPLIEKIANYFRGPVRYRRQLAFEILKEKKSESVLELGCGSGELAISLVLNAGIKHVTGIDISEQAIAVAQNRAASMNLTQNLTFIHSSVAELDFQAIGKLELCTRPWADSIFKR